jgi:hypothetical protein
VTDTAAVAAAAVETLAVAWPRVGNLVRWMQQVQATRPDTLSLSRWSDPLRPTVEYQVKCASHAGRLRRQSTQSRLQASTCNRKSISCLEQVEAGRGDVAAAAAAAVTMEAPRLPCVRSVCTDAFEQRTTVQFLVGETAQLMTDSTSTSWTPVRAGTPGFAQNPSPPMSHQAPHYMPFNRNTGEGAKCSTYRFVSVVSALHGGLSGCAHGVVQEEDAIGELPRAERLAQLMLNKPSSAGDGLTQAAVTISTRIPHDPPELLAHKPDAAPPLPHYLCSVLGTRQHTMTR